MPAVSSGACSGPILPGDWARTRPRHSRLGDGPQYYFRSISASVFSSPCTRLPSGSISNLCPYATKAKLHVLRDRGSAHVRAHCRISTLCWQATARPRQEENIYIVNGIIQTARASNNWAAMRRGGIIPRVLWQAGCCGVRGVCAWAFAKAKADRCAKNRCARALFTRVSRVL